MVAILILGALGLGIAFACTFTNWEQVEEVKVECDSCGHSHKEYIVKG